jgi:hypothetical protein
MRSDAAIALIRSLVAPVGPFSTYSDALDARDRAIAQAPMEDLQTLLELAQNPPALLSGEKQQEWDRALIDTIAAWGRRDPSVAVSMLEGKITNPTVRPVVISVVELLRDPVGFRLLEPLVESSAGLSPDEQSRLVSALAAIGGDHAEHLLQELAGSISTNDPDVAKAFALARKIVGQPANVRWHAYPTTRELYEMMMASGKR